MPLGSCEKPLTRPSPKRTPPDYAPPFHAPPGTPAPAASRSLRDTPPPQPDTHDEHEHEQPARKGFFKVPNELMDLMLRNQIDALALGVCVAVLSFYRKRRSPRQVIGCWASLKSIAARAGCSVDTVERRLKVLVGIGILNKTRRFRPGTGAYDTSLYTWNGSERLEYQTRPVADAAPRAPRAAERARPAQQPDSRFTPLALNDEAVLWISLTHRGGPGGAFRAHDDDLPFKSVLFEQGELLKCVLDSLRPDEQTPETVRQAEELLFARVMKRASEYVAAGEYTQPTPGLVMRWLRDASGRIDVSTHQAERERWYDAAVRYYPDPDLPDFQEFKREADRKTREIIESETPLAYANEENACRDRECLRRQRDSTQFFGRKGLTPAELDKLESLETRCEDFERRKFVVFREVAYDTYVQVNDTLVGYRRDHALWTVKPAERRNRNVAAWDAHIAAYLASPYRTVPPRTEPADQPVPLAT